MPHASPNGQATALAAAASTTKHSNAVARPGRRPRQGGRRAGAVTRVATALAPMSAGEVDGSWWMGGGGVLMVSDLPRWWRGRSGGRPVDGSWRTRARPTARPADGIDDGSAGGVSAE